MSEHKLKGFPPSPEHLRVRAALMEFCKKEMATIDAEIILAILSHTVGQLVALQDQRKMTPTKAMDLVARNIEVGNAEAIRGLMQSKGSA